MKSHSEEIIDLHYNLGLSYTEIGNKLNKTRSSIAGIVWRYNNPNIWTKTKSNTHPDKLENKKQQRLKKKLLNASTS